MDTKKLVVGQDVYMDSGVYGQKGKVVKVTPGGVEVVSLHPEDGTATGRIYHFDNNGRGLEAEGTHECGPWELDDRT